MIRRLLLLFVLLLFFRADMLSAAEQNDIITDPLVHGAWLFRVHCIRCHGDYEKERPAEDYTSADKLEKTVGEKGCRISWARSRGGTLSPAEIKAVSRYMLSWEDLGREPDLPTLPEIPQVESVQPNASQSIETDSFSVQIVEKTGEAGLSLPLAQLVRKNKVAQGAWLYTGNCYRCHLSYTDARLGRSLKGEKLQKMIENGKTSTQMSGFAILAGGKLKKSDIAAIMSYITVWESYGRPLAIAHELLKPPSVNASDLLPAGLPRYPLVAGDVALGENLYVMHCSRCHGNDRTGYIGRALTPPWMSLRPDLFLKSTIKSGIAHSLMRPFSGDAGGSLSPKQIDSLVVFLLNADRHEVRGQ